MVNSPDPQVLRSHLMRQIAPLSVLTRGDDTLHRRARRDERAFVAQQASARAAAAAERGSSDDQLSALRDQLAEAVSRADEAEQAFAEADDLSKALAEEVTVLRAQLEQLRLALRYAEEPHLTEGPEPTLDDVPHDLLPGDKESFTKLAEHLERATEGRLVFTENAASAWKKAREYPTPDQMRDELVKLAKAARDLYDGTERTMGRLTKWVRETYDLKISLQDDQLPKAARTFDFDGRTLDRTPHVKVNDGVPPYACGRIYFALDSEHSMIVVDHVGVHL